MKLLEKKSKGFTIIEVVMVVSLAMLVLLIIYEVYLISNKSFTLGDRQLEILQNGRVVLDRLVRELRQTPEVVTSLPINPSAFPPPAEIEFQDGHDLTNIQYIRYYLIENSLYRQLLVYFFSSEPSTHVYWNAQDEFGQSPESEVVENKIIAEYIDDIDFYGASVINIDIWLNKLDTTKHLYTAVWGRNSTL